MQCLFRESCLPDFPEGSVKPSLGDKPLYQEFKSCQGMRVGVHMRGEGSDLPRASSLVERERERECRFRSYEHLCHRIPPNGAMQCRSRLGFRIAALTSKLLSSTTHIRAGT